MKEVLRRLRTDTAEATTRNLDFTVLGRRREEISGNDLSLQVSRESTENMITAPERRSLPSETGDSEQSSD